MMGSPRSDVRNSLYNCRNRICSVWMCFCMCKNQPSLCSTSERVLKNALHSLFWTVSRVLGTDWKFDFITTPQWEITIVQYLRFDTAGFVLYFCATHSIHILQFYTFETETFQEVEKVKIRKSEPERLVVFWRIQKIVFFRTTRQAALIVRFLASKFLLCTIVDVLTVYFILKCQQWTSGQSYKAPTIVIYAS